MNCPKCEQDTLNRAQFRTNKRIAYICLSCNTFWYVSEHINKMTGHSFEESRDDQHADDFFDYLDEGEKEYQEDLDTSERITYELF